MWFTLVSWLRVRSTHPNRVSIVFLSGVCRQAERISFPVDQARDRLTISNLQRLDQQNDHRPHRPLLSPHDNPPGRLEREKLQ